MAGVPLVLAARAATPARDAHHDGISWAEIGAAVGQTNLKTTADRYTHALADYVEIDREAVLAGS